MADSVREDMVGHYTIEPKVHRHLSPTKRLISHKNTAQEHQKILRDTVDYSMNESSYRIGYCVAPGKSIVVEPQGGQIPYELVE